MTQSGRCRRDSLSSYARAEFPNVRRLLDFDRAELIGKFWVHPETRTLGELLIDLEEDKILKAVIRGLLREMERK